MPYTALILSAELLPNLHNASWVIVDCRFELDDKDAGEGAYRNAHIPGAVYAHLERDLSAAPSSNNGRHPLPSITDLTALFSRWGIEDGVQVVAYDARGGGFAARLWWSLRYLGHDAVAVLNGGFPAWEREGYPVSKGDEQRSPSTFQPNLQPEMLVDVSVIEASLEDKNVLLLDSRSGERYRAEEEMIDPVAGHIPGALNHFWGSNLDADGLFLTEEKLRARFDAILGEKPLDSAIVYCGSGVTACHNLLALEHVGLQGARLYAGSWSEWITNPDHPIVSRR
jgi:thiosulfate/3-mercaptopyruvate sulfurtransferase